MQTATMGAAAKRGKRFMLRLVPARSVNLREIREQRFFVHTFFSVNAKHLETTKTAPNMSNRRVPISIESVLKT